MYDNNLETFRKSINFFDNIENKIVTVKKECNKICVRQIVRGSILFKDLKKNNIYQSELINLDFKLSIDGEDIHDESYYVKKVDKLETVETEDSERIKISITSVQNFDIPLQNKIEIQLFLLEELEDLVVRLANELVIKDIKNSAYKITILSKDLDREEVFNSEVFNITTFSTEEQLSGEIFRFVNNASLEEEKLNIIPHCLTEKFSIKSRKSFAINQLNKIFEENKNGKLLIHRKGLKCLDTNEFKFSFGECYDEISRLNLFVGSDERYYTEKLHIMRKNLFDTLDAKEEYLNAYFWEKILDLTKNDFCLFIDDAVANFLSEKKDIIKEQYTLSKELTNQITTLTKSLTTNLIFLITVFVSKFFIDGLSKHSSTIGSISLYLGLAVSIIYLLLFLLSGDRKLHTSFEKKLKLMVNEFPKLYLTKDNLLVKLENNITTPELNRLKRIENFSLIMYSIIIIFFFIASVCSLIEAYL